jgi:hypothetical protein
MHSDEGYHTFAGSCRRRRPPDARGEGRFVLSTLKRPFHYPLNFLLSLLVAGSLRN